MNPSELPGNPLESCGAVTSFPGAGAVAGGHPTRRDFVHALAATACGWILGAQPLHAAGRSAKASVKKGACGGIRGIPGLTKLRAKWYYNWGAKPPEPAPPATIEWVPIIFPHGVDKIAGDCQRVKAAKCKVLLGYNEPDHRGQGNISVEVAVKHWPTLMETGIKLVSPAVTWAPNKWMRDFMKQAKEKNLRIDAVAIHWYGAPNAKAFLDYVNAAHQLYGKPIWITEFAAQDKQATKDRPCRFTNRDVLRFMREVLPELEKLDWVERYCWYTPHRLADVRTGPSCLLDDASELTALGEYFASV